MGDQERIDRLKREAADSLRSAQSCLDEGRIAESLRRTARAARMLDELLTEMHR